MGHSANCGRTVLPVVLTDVGSYTGSASPNGTFDQGGNVWEWNEWASASISRGLRGGSYFQTAALLVASWRYANSVLFQVQYVGFRVASTVPPPVPALGPIGLLLVAASLLGFSAYRRGRA